MHKVEFFLKNETHKIPWDFEIQTDQLIPAKRPDQILINKKTCLLVDFAVTADHRMKIKESKKIDKYLNFARELKKTNKLRNMRVIFQRAGKKGGGTGN